MSHRRNFLTSMLTVLFVAAIALTALTVIVSRAPAAKQPANPATDQAAGGPQASSADAAPGHRQTVVIGADYPATMSPAAGPQREPPVGWEGFWTWDAAQQLAAVTALQDETGLPLQIRLHLTAVLLRTGLDETVRNNAANILLAQQDIDPDLATQLIRMIDDPRESPRWRDYAVQHLAASALTMRSPALVEKKLWDVVRHGQLGIPGTALLQLHHLDKNGIIALADPFTDILIGIMADPQRDVVVRMTAIALVGEREVSHALTALRAVVTDPLPSIRRVALSALGRIGGEEDLARIMAYRDPLIDPIILSSAIDTLRQRLSTVPDDAATAISEPSGSF